MECKDFAYRKVEIKLPRPRPITLTNRVVFRLDIKDTLVIRHFMVTWGGHIKDTLVIRHFMVTWGVHIKDTLVIRHFKVTWGDPKTAD